MFLSLQKAGILSTISAKLNIFALFAASSSSFERAAAALQGVLAKQDWSPSHSALVPLGQGLALSHFATSSLQDLPQKNLDVTSSFLFPSLTATRGVQIVGAGEPSWPGKSFPANACCSGDGSSFCLQGVPLKHCCLFGQSVYK